MTKEMTMPFTPTRRSLLTAAAGLPLVAAAGVLRAAEPDLAGLSDMTAGVQPISAAERNAQALMKAANIGAVLIEPGSSQIYFTGVRWSRSERLTAAVIPVEGEVLIVTPFFEEPSVRETLAVPAEVRVWQEDEDPLRLIADYLKERGFAARPIGIEETVRYFAVDGSSRQTRWCGAAA